MSSTVFWYCTLIFTDGTTLAVIMNDPILWCVRIHTHTNQPINTTSLYSFGEFKSKKPCRRTFTVPFVPITTTTRDDDWFQFHYGRRRRRRRLVLVSQQRIMILKVVSTFPFTTNKRFVFFSIHLLPTSPSLSFLLISTRRIMPRKQMYRKNCNCWWKKEL